MTRFDFRVVPPVDYDRRPAAPPKPDCIEMLRERLNRSTVEKIGDALESRFALGVYVGIYIGCMITVGMAFVWSVLS